MPFESFYTQQLETIKAWRQQCVRVDEYNTKLLKDEKPKTYPAIDMSNDCFYRTILFELGFPEQHLRFIPECIVDLRIKPWELIEFWLGFENNIHAFRNYFVIPLARGWSKHITYEKNMELQSKPPVKPTRYVTSDDMKKIACEYYGKTGCGKYSEDMAEDYVKEFNRLGFHWLSIDGVMYNKENQ